MKPKVIAYLVGAMMVISHGGTVLGVSGPTKEVSVDSSTTRTPQNGNLERGKPLPEHKSTPARGGGASPEGAQKKTTKKKPVCLERVPEPYRSEICKVAPKYGADPYLVASILFYENRSWPRTDKVVCSSAGACGVMQFIPETWERYAVDADGGGADRSSWKDSISAGANYLGSMKKDLRNSAIEYNAGPRYHGSADMYLPAETRDYVYGVVRAYRYLKGT